MGDMADWTIDQGIGLEGQQIESRSKAKALSDQEIVKLLIDCKDSDENILDADFAAKVQSICEWYLEKGFVTSKQRSCLNSAYVQLHLALET